MLDAKILVEMIKTKTCAVCGGKTTCETVYNKYGKRDDEAARVLCHRGHSWEFQWEYLQQKGRGRKWPKNNVDSY